jgi:hypothetical protein
MQHESSQRLLASNPNTPEIVLLGLARHFPHEVANNPMLMLLYLEDPDIIQKMDRMDLIEILQSENPPEMFMYGAINYPNSQVRRTLLTNPCLSEKFLEQAVDKIDDIVSARPFIQHPSCSERIKLIIASRPENILHQALAQSCLNDEKELPVRLLEVLIDNATISVKATIASHIRTTNDLLVRILNSISEHTGDSYSKVRGLIARRSDLSLEALAYLIQDKSDIVQRSLVGNMTIRAATLTVMSQDQRLPMRELTAKHPNTPAEILEKLEHDEKLQKQLAGNPHTPIKILERIANKGTQDIALIKNLKTPHDIVRSILIKLSIDPHYKIRKLVARHHQTPQSVLAQLAADPEPKVSSIAKKHLIN